MKLLALAMGAACAALIGADPAALVRQVADYDYGKDPTAVRELESLVLRSAGGSDGAIERLLIAGLASALEVIAAADHRRRRLRDNAARLRTCLRELGYAIASGSQIIGLESGIESETLGLRCFLETQGVYGSVLCAPATRLDESLIRLSVHAGLTDVDLDHIVEVCASARDHVRFANWASTQRQCEHIPIDT